MRIGTLTIAVLLVPALSGCAPDCGAVNQFNTLTYRVFANPFEYTNDNPVFLEGPEFWSYGTPANGVSQWNFAWTGAAVGPVTVTIDGQTFEGTGELDEVECGQALVTFNGLYVDDANNVEHNFNASMSMTLWSEQGGGLMGAYLIWKESWTHPSSENGTFTANAHLTGELVSQ